MNAASSRKASRAALSRPHPLSLSRPDPGHRVLRPAAITPVQPAPAQAPRPGRLRLLWQRVSALWTVTPEQWHAHEMACRTEPGGDSLRAGVLLGGRLALMPPAAPTTARRSSQPDLP